MEMGLLIIFWYGVLHAFGPDHLTAIADFSIGRQRKKVMMVTLGFAIGHGASLYLFALLLSSLQIPEGWLAYGDVIASSVIILMGLYLLYLVLADRIHVSKHEHEGKEHIHIWFGKEHHHRRPFFNWLSTSAMLGILMGMGGARGMLVSLSAISSQDVSGWMVLSFTLGVALVFMVFGGLLALINARLMTSKQWLKGTFTFAGLISCWVGLQAFL
ncbi:hypothetical protein QCB45_05085 [Thiomicrorhabdus sp. ZW0627]|uniref:hypothetical protein n=1 Tax=Thiomicrorhabdus sp. ZW0627 TaxID=3039774 RepID=UPI0024371D09|nr:hypothetical protein [Thiomicrorhabdus sp. ZW0627]MDG6773697.1 hypothetical protein [Thiomicrorhabdus sp. ZW0627]